MPYLFQVSIGPVQAFIASARRTRDLWFGSWLLSELAKAAALKIVEQKGDLIFPAPLDIQALNPGTGLNVANKIVAQISCDPQELGRQVKQALDARLEYIWTQAVAPIKNYDQITAQKQIDDMIELFWVALPWNEGDRYANVRANLEALMAARKNTRDFGKVTWGSNQPKSSITGHLESVIPKNGNLTAEQRRAFYGAGPAEQLSGIDLLKRKGNPGENAHFLSTSHIAALSFLERLKHVSEQDTIRLSWKKYLEELHRLKVDIETIRGPNLPSHPIIDLCDGAMLFEERLDDKVDNVSQLKDAKALLRSFFKCIDDQLGSARPSPYYAILHADGDGMGAVIDHQAKEEDGSNQHRKLSKALDVFANEAGTIVRSHYGALVYSGGDDVLAFVPLHTVLGCARELADRFKDLLAAFDDTNKHTPTLSVGVAIVHHLTPLSDALDLARTAEKIAKKVDGKNALAITVSKRSGGDTSVKGQWRVFDTDLQKFVSLHRHEAIPDGAAYELRDLHDRLMPPSTENENQFWEMLRKEAKRILLRKRKPGGETAFSKEYASRLVQNTGLANRTLADLANELIVARVLADAADLAKCKLPPLQTGEVPA